jgi:hypothetical protein
MMGWMDGRMDGKLHFIPTSFIICNVHFFLKIKIVYLVVAILLAQDEERWDGQVIQEGDTL